MLTSLAAVLGLLAVGFYCLSVGATGRAGAGEGTALSARTRALVLLLSVGSLGGAYLLYQRPLQPTAAIEDALESPVTAADFPASAEQPTEAVAADGLELAAGAEPKAGPASEEEQLALEAESTNAPQPQPQPQPSATILPTPRAAPEEEQLSSAALALENARRPPPLTSQPVEQVPAPVTAAIPVVKPTVRELPMVAASAPRRAAPPPVATPPKKPKPRSDTPVRSMSTQTQAPKAMPVMLYVQNTLGPAQTREQLMLSIEGRAVADLAVDRRRPGVEVSVPLPRGGLLHYRLEGVTDDGTTQLEGEGCIRVQDAARFDVRRQLGSQTVFLEATTTRLAP